MYGVSGAERAIETESGPGEETESYIRCMYYMYIINTCMYILCTVYDTFMSVHTMYMYNVCVL